MRAYGTIPNNNISGPIASFTVDSNMTSTGIINITSINASSFENNAYPNYLFFDIDTGVLDDFNTSTNHTVVINSKIDNAVYLDYFLIPANGYTPTASSPSSTPPSSPSADAQSHQSKIPYIEGGVLGGSAFVALMAVALAWFLRGHRARKKARDGRNSISEIFNQPSRSQR